jgi:hypothetical protein
MLTMVIERFRNIPTAWAIAALTSGVTLRFQGTDGILNRHTFPTINLRQRPLHHVPVR